jgi:hypothetical protein
MSRNPEEIVRAAEAAYTTLDIDEIMALFDPEIVLVWNGKVAARGLDELRRWHEERHAGRKSQTIRKTLRAASGDTIAVEWIARWNDPATGTPMEGHGGEFWRMRGDRLLEWHAYAQSYSAQQDEAELPLTNSHSD